MSRIPSLDGLRGISIALVLAGHLSGTRNLLGGGRLPDVHTLGDLGVRVFFVISGFLITGLLLDEIDRRGRISVARFYARRALRIFPAAYLYMAVVLGLGAAGILRLAPDDAVHALTYTVNYHHMRSWYVSHLWSLGVEEQFYLGWPLVLALLGRRIGLGLAAALVVAAPVVRVVTFAGFPDRRVEIGEAFSTVADALATGCLLAGLRARLGRSPRYLAFLRSRWFFVVAGLGAAAFAFDRFAFIDYALGQTILNVAIALAIDRWTRFPEGAVGLVLNGRALVWLGTLSYSIYLWHAPFVNPIARGDATVFPVSVALAFACAVASYRLLERPLLGLRGKLRRTGAPG